MKFLLSKVVIVIAIAIGVVKNLFLFLKIHKDDISHIK